jgi:hypothetical protein
MSLTPELRHRVGGVPHAQQDSAGLTGEPDPDLAVRRCRAGVGDQLGGDEMGVIGDAFEMALLLLNSWADRGVATRMF